jgi:cytochrome P450
VIAPLPGPHEWFPGAHLLAFRHNPLAFLCALHQTYGDVVAYRLGPERVVLVTHPEVIREVLVTQHRHFVKARRGTVSTQFLGAGLLSSEGGVHRRQRRLVQPAFAPHRVEQYAAVMTAYGTRLCHHWREGETRDIAQAMAQVTLAIAGKALFGAELDAEAPTIGAALTTLMQFILRFVLPLADPRMGLPFPSTLRVRRVSQYLYATIARLLEARQAHGTDTGDVLSMLLQDSSAHEEPPW